MENEKGVNEIEPKKEAGLQIGDLKERLGKLEQQLKNLLNNFPTLIMNAIHKHLDLISQIKGAIQLTKQEIDEL